MQSNHNSHKIIQAMVELARQDQMPPLTVKFIERMEFRRNTYQLHTYKNPESSDVTYLKLELISKK